MSGEPYLSLPSIFSGGATKLVPGVVRLEAERAIELRRVRDGLVDREPEVRRVEDQVVAADLDRLRRELLHRFLGPLAARCPTRSESTKYS